MTVKFDVVSINNPNKIDSRWDTLDEAEDHIREFGLCLEFEVNIVTIKKRRVMVMPFSAQKIDV